MNERDSTENTENSETAAPYEPPTVEDLDTSKGPLATAPGVPPTSGGVITG